MEFKVLACFAFLAVCAFVTEVSSQEQTYDSARAAPEPDTATAPAAGSAVDNGVTREKKQALLPVTAYSGAYPYYSGYAYPYAYSYGAYDDGKYYPGKYEKPYLYRSYPAAGAYYNYPGYYYY